MCLTSVCKRPVPTIPRCVVYAYSVVAVVKLFAKSVGWTMAQNPGHVEKPSWSRCTLPKHTFIDHGPMLVSTVVRGWARRVMSKVHGRTSWFTMGGDAHVFRNIASCGAVLDNLQHEATWTRFFRLGRERTNSLLSSLAFELETVLAHGVSRVARFPCLASQPWTPAAVPCRCIVGGVGSDSRVVLHD